MEQIETDVQAADARRRELAKLNLLVRKLQRQCVTVSDDTTGELAAKIIAAVVGLAEADEAQYGPLPAVSDQAAGLSVPLHLLDTPANRRFLAALEDAHACGLRVDMERGYGDDGPAQDLEDWVCKVREEVCGPAGGQE